MYDEPVITINGHALTAGQAMTVRVAIEGFASDLKERGLGTDDHGLRMTYGYLKNVDAIRDLIFNR